VNDWFRCDSDDPGYHIMTDEEIVDSLRSEEMVADENEVDVDTERTTFLHTAMVFKLWT
jgi:flagellar basal body rod protein FlgB